MIFIVSDNISDKHFTDSVSLREITAAKLHLRRSAPCDCMGEALSALVPLCSIVSPEQEAKAQLEGEVQSHRNHGLSTETGRKARHPQWERQRGANTHELHQEGESKQEEPQLDTEKWNQGNWNFVLLPRYCDINRSCQFQMLHLGVYMSYLLDICLLGLYF